MITTMSRSSCLTLALTALFTAASGLPMLIVDQGRPKCIAVEAPKYTILKVSYVAPDLILDPTHAKYGPTYITVTERPAVRAHEDAYTKKLKRKKPVPPTTKTLTEKEGIITHKVMDDGDINICIRASSAGKENPLRFSLKIEDGDDTEKDEMKKDADVGYQLTFMENEMLRIEGSMHKILREADFAKERDAVFHKQTDAMNSATVFWPIMQVCILLATGFTQANHIVRFFKQRRIL